MGVRKIAAWMGLVEDGRYQTDDPIDDEEATNEVYVDEPSQEVSKVSQLPTRRPAPLAPVASKEVADISRIVSVRPRSFNEARVIGENFRDGIPVIMNLSELEDGEDKRLVDFAAGLVFGLQGAIERVTNKVFLLSPADVEVTTVDGAPAKSAKGLFNQS